MLAYHAEPEVHVKQAPVLLDFHSQANGSKPTDASSLHPSDNGYYRLDRFLHNRASEDDESRYGFWGEPDHVADAFEPASLHDNPLFGRGIAAFFYLWCAFSMILFGACGLYFSIDLAFSYYGMGTGVAQWAMCSDQPLSIASHRQMKSCLATKNLEAHVPSLELWSVEVLLHNSKRMRAPSSAVVRTCTLAMGHEQHYESTPDSVPSSSEAYGRHGIHSDTTNWINFVEGEA